MNSEKTSTTHESSCACKDCASGKRNRFFLGKNMKAGEFQIEQEYGIKRRRLLNRSVTGWGVVYGLALDGPRPLPDVPSPVPAELKVGHGLALDRHGREAVVVEPVAIGLTNTVLLEPSASGGCHVRSITALQPGRYVLSIYYAERRIGDAKLPEGCGCATPEKNFVCETVVFALTKICDGKCSCAEPRCDRACVCGAPGCCAAAGRGPHACLCQWTAQAKVPGEPGPLCEWQGYWLDPADGIGLACVCIKQAGDKCTPAVLGWVEDDCSPRRLVKNNDLLYDLIRGCDLTRIKSISWGEWHRREPPVPWAEFVKKLSTGVPDQADHVTGLTVTFTGPVKVATVTPDCIAFKFTVTGEDTGWFETRTVSIPRVMTSEHRIGDPAGTARTATLCVDSDWYEEVTSHGSKFKREGATVQIEVNGDFILDCHGQAVDANARGFALRDTGDPNTIEPSGNGTPGGVFVSVFRIEQRPPTQRST